MSQPHTHQDCQQPPSTDLPAAVLPILALTFVLLLIVVGGGLVYVTLTHPSVAVPLTVATAGVTFVVTIASTLVALVTRRR